jgi:hypothetical protein
MEVNENYLQSYQDIKDYLSGEKIQCLICKKTFSTINAQHLSKKHNLSILEYKKMFGIPFSVGLTGSIARAKLSAHSKERYDNGELEELKKYGVAKEKHSTKHRFKTQAFKDKKEKAFVNSKKVRDAMGFIDGVVQCECGKCKKGLVVAFKHYHRWGCKVKCVECKKLERKEYNKKYKQGRMYDKTN